MGRQREEEAEEEDEQAQVPEAQEAHEETDVEGQGTEKAFNFINSVFFLVKL